MFPWRVKLPGLPYLNKQQLLAVGHCWKVQIMRRICAPTGMDKAWHYQQPTSHWASLKHQRLSSELQLTLAHTQWQFSAGWGRYHPIYLLFSSEKNSWWLNTVLKQLLSLHIFSEAMKGETAADFCLYHAENHQCRNFFTCSCQTPEEHTSEHCLKG